MPDTPDIEPDEIDLYTFPRDVDRIFRDVQTSRLARALDNSPRNVQRWVNGNDPAPAHAIAFVNSQIAILEGMEPGPYALIRQQCRDMLAAGLHPEVVASMLSVIYQEITDKSIR